MSPLKEKEEWIGRYDAGEKLDDIASAYNVSRQTVTNYVSRFRSIRHRGPQSKMRHEDYFDEIDTEEKAYFLGWLMADGCVAIANGQYSLKINIAYKDKELIEKFQKAIGSTHHLLKRNHKKNGASHQSAYVSITSRHMCESLMKLGVIPRKTGKEIISPIKEKFVRHFIRGYFDGDGITNCKNGKRRSGFISSSEVLQGIQKRLGTNIKCFHPNNTKTENVYYFESGIRFSKKLYKYIYKDATIWLSRKRKRMDTICGNTEITVSNKSEAAS